jgi:DNA-binding GntR family transcriptional regulator
MLKRYRLDRSIPVRRQAADLVQDAIMKGVLCPGEKLRQRALANQFKLSHSAVREVLIELENRGLLTKRRSTYTVAHVSEDDYHDLVAMRCLLEPAACRLAAQQWHMGVGGELERCLERMRQALRVRDYMRSWECDRQFHRIIWKNQPNRILEAHLEKVCTQIFTFYLSQSFVWAYYPKANVDRIIREHQLILEVLRTRDGQRAERVVRRILERAGRRGLKMLHRVWRAELKEQPAS